MTAGWVQRSEIGVLRRSSGHGGLFAVGGGFGGGFVIHKGLDQGLECGTLELPVVVPRCCSGVSDGLVRPVLFTGRKL